MALAMFARTLEDKINRYGTARKRAKGWVPRITGFIGYGSPHAVKILARATMANPKDARPFHLPHLPRNAHTFSGQAMQEIMHLARERSREAQRGWRQFFTTDVGFLPVTVKVGNRVIKTRTDRSGYIDLLVRNHGLDEGWHSAEIIPVAGEPATAPVMVVAANTDTGLVSDIDDTIMVTMLPRALLATYNAFILHTNNRKEVPGMVEFYDKLLRNKPDAPVFYLSTGAWNVYSTLLEFIQLRGFPTGPMLLTDWGPTPTALFRSGLEHKKTQLRNLLIMYPHIKWYLVGDDGQYDPLIYDELAREHPSRVRGIALRQLNPVEQVLAHGTMEASEAKRDDSDIEKRGVPIIRGADGFALARQMEAHRDFN